MSTVVSSHSGAAASPVVSPDSARAGHAIGSQASFSPRPAAPTAACTSESPPLLLSARSASQPTQKMLPVAAARMLTSVRARDMGTMRTMTLSSVTWNAVTVSTTQATVTGAAIQ